MTRATFHLEAKQLLNRRSASLWLVSLVAVFTLSLSILGAPGPGILLDLLLIGGVVWLRRSGWRSLGFCRPKSWRKYLLLALLLSLLIQFLLAFALDPVIRFLTDTPIDLSPFDHLRGNLKALLTWLLIVWFLVVFIEEIIFRGFLMLELRRLLGDSQQGMFINLALTSVLFGLAHWYQGPSGILGTGFVGFLLGWIFIRNGFNLWLPILVHGFIDTIGLTLIYFNADQFLEQFW